MAPWPSHFLCVCVHAFTSMYICKRWFCQVKVIKMSEIMLAKKRKMSLHAFCDVCVYASHIGLHVITLA